jgi:hypothetical protein
MTKPDAIFANAPQTDEFFENHDLNKSFQEERRRLACRELLN